MTETKATKPRTRKPWSADFESVQDRLADALGCEVRWFAEYGEIHFRDGDGAMTTAAAGLPERRDAYHWMLGRLAAAPDPDFEVKR